MSEFSSQIFDCLQNSTIATGPLVKATQCWEYQSHVSTLFVHLSILFFIAKMYLFFFFHALLFQNAHCALISPFPHDTQPPSVNIITIFNTTILFILQQPYIQHVSLLFFTTLRNFNTLSTQQKHKHPLSYRTSHRVLFIDLFSQKSVPLVNTPDTIQIQAIQQLLCTKKSQNGERVVKEQNKQPTTPSPKQTIEPLSTKTPTPQSLPAQHHQYPICPDINSK